MKKVSDSELEVLKIIWKKKETTSKDIIEELKYQKWKDNTIRTLINRLIAKKAVGISKKEGKTYLYVPLISEKEYREFAKKNFLKQLFHGSAYECANFLIKKDEKVRKEIELLLKELKNKQEK